MEERCVVCGAIIPEGRQVCPLCEMDVNTIEYDLRRMSAAFPDYPCLRCKSKTKHICRCGKWETWFRNIWRKFRRNLKKQE